MMKSFLLGTATLAAAALLTLNAGAAVAQTTTSESTTTTTPAVPMIEAPPAGTLSTTRTQKVIGADGSQTDKTQSTYRNSNGVAEDTMTRTTTVPPPAVTTSHSSTSTTTTTE